MRELDVPLFTVPFTRDRPGRATAAGSCRTPSRRRPTRGPATGSGRRPPVPTRSTTCAPRCSPWIQTTRTLSRSALRQAREPYSARRTGTRSCPAARPRDRGPRRDGGWIGLEHDPNRNRWTYGRLSAGLTGQAGIGLALATVAARAADPPPGARPLARAALLGSVERIGPGHRGPADAFGGPAGVLYAAAVAARLLDDAILLRARPGA